MNEADVGVFAINRAEGASFDNPERNTAAQETVVLYENCVPPFCITELDRLYGSILSTFDQFNLDDALAGASTYVATKNGEIKTVLVFRYRDGMVSVLNQMIRLEREELERFAEIIFDRFPSASAISLTAIQTDLCDFPYPSLKLHWAEDIVAPLPDCEKIFLSSLGRNMRETVKRYSNRIARDFPALRFDAYVDAAIDYRHAMEIYRFHKARMFTKNKESNVDEQRFRKIITLARTRGLMTVASIDGRVCGGLICWRAGRDYYMRIIAHDPAYDEYKLGTVFCYRTMCECIARGGKAFHFMSGRMLYKYRFLGVDQDFDTVILYRSRMNILRNIRKMSGTIATGLSRQTRLWLQNAERRNDLLSRAAHTCVRQWRAIKRMKGELRQMAMAIRR